MSATKLRLLVTERCDRDCALCVNKQYDLRSLPIAETFDGFDEVIITGGEPMLVPERVVATILKCYKMKPRPRVYLHTARVPWVLASHLSLLAGITHTIHNKTDINDFLLFCDLGFVARQTFGPSLRHLSLRLVSFIPLDDVDTRGWTVKQAVWRKDCPLPEGEVFMRLA